MAIMVIDLCEHKRASLCNEVINDVVELLSIDHIEDESPYTGLSVVRELNSHNMTAVAT